MMGLSILHALDGIVLLKTIGFFPLRFSNIAITIK
jgi:hypothetical protein